MDNNGNNLNDRNNNSSMYNGNNNGYLNNNVYTNSNGYADNNGCANNNAYTNNNLYGDNNSYVNNNLYGDNHSYTNNGGTVYKKDDGIIKGIFIGILISAMCFLVIFIINKSDNGYVAEDKDNGTVTINADYKEIYEKINAIEEYVKKYYYYTDEIEIQDLIDDAIKGYVVGLGDKYAAYYTADEFKQITSEKSGTYCGIGVAVQMDTTTNMIIAINPYEDAPGYKAGIRKGDYIVGVDGMDITGMTLDEVVDMMRGEEGTDVVVTVYRNGDTFDFTVTREKIETHTVSLEMLDGDIAYVSITSFDANTDEQFIELVDSAIEDGAKAFIFDVRSNGGGYLETVINMLDRILPEGAIVYTEDKYGNREEQTSDDTCIDLPMCVLVNEYSASASEIFAGAIQDYELGAIIGKNTYGKGIVQNTFVLPDGSAIKFTISAYLTPNGRNIHGEGIKPDIDAEFEVYDDTYDENGVLVMEKDTQLKSALEYINEKIN